MGHALPRFDGDVWAPDLVQHDGKFYIYYKSSYGNRVVWAEDMAGPWSEPVGLSVGGIDPGHVVGEDGRRYIHLSGGRVIGLRQDGLAVEGESEQVYEGWPIPADWCVECFALEGPKLVQHGGYYHLVSAQGGTAGPATSHMVVTARSRHPLGPWENNPHNPIVRTQSSDELWWSRGHGTIFDDAAGNWWVIYHGYRKDFVTLGRQTLLQAVTWTEEGWPVLDVSRALPEAPPKGERRDALRRPNVGTMWRFSNSDGKGRIGACADGIRMAGIGPLEQTTEPMMMIPSDLAYEVEVAVHPPEVGAVSWLCLFYDPGAWVGIARDEHGLRVGARGTLQPPRMTMPPSPDGTVRLRIRNDQHVVTMHWAMAGSGQDWRPLPPTREMSGWHHNTFGEFLSLRAGLHVSGTGGGAFSDFVYRPLPEAGKPIDHVAPTS